MEKLSYTVREVGSKDEELIQTSQHVNKPYQMGLSRSSHDYLIIRGESGGLKREGGLNNFLSLKGGVGLIHSLWYTTVLLTKASQRVHCLYFLWLFPETFTWLYDMCSTQRRGMHDLKVWPGVEADGQDSTSTPGKSTAGEDQMSRLAKVWCMVNSQFPFSPGPDSWIIRVTCNYDVWDKGNLESIYIGLKNF